MSYVDRTPKKSWAVYYYGDCPIRGGSVVFFKLFTKLSSVKRFCNQYKEESDHYPLAIKKLRRPYPY